MLWLQFWITVKAIENVHASEYLCSPRFVFVWCVFCLKVLCAEEFEDTKGIHIEVENTTQWQIIVCPVCFVHLVSFLRLTDSDIPFRIFKLFLLYIKRWNNFRILVTRQQYHRKRKRIKIVRIFIFVVYLWNVWTK